jgi:hypothetical protein
MKFAIKRSTDGKEKKGNKHQEEHEVVDREEVKKDSRGKGGALREIRYSIRKKSSNTLQGKGQKANGVRRRRRRLRREAYEKKGQWEIRTSAFGEKISISKMVLLEVDEEEEEEEAEAEDEEDEEEEVVEETETDDDEAEEEEEEAEEDEEELEFLDAVFLEKKTGGSEQRGSNQQESEYKASRDTNFWSS